MTILILTMKIIFNTLTERRTNRGLGVRRHDA